MNKLTKEGLVLYLLGMYIVMAHCVATQEGEALHRT